MLEHVPAWLGKALGSIRAGIDSVAVARPDLATDAAIALTSPDFVHEGRLPMRVTADGPGLSPALAWDAPPAGTARLALLVEDADAPAPQPLVHAIVWGLPAGAGMLAAGDIVGDGGEVGRNSYLRLGWLPPDPPTGHGPHRYVFQLFALDDGAPDPGKHPGRSAIIEAMTGHVIAAGVLIGTYSRGEEAPIGPVGSSIPA